MIMKFTLTMPNRNSWDNKWTGDDKEYSICKTVRTKTDIERAKELEGKSFYHNFGDGWGASIDCNIVDVKEARRSRKKTAGFCGYDWMITSLWAGKYDEKASRFICKKN